VATRVALEGLDVTDDGQVAVGDEPGAFAGAVLRLLDSPTVRTRLGLAGRAYVERRHDWRAIGRRLVEIYEGSTAAYPSASMVLHG
jgi:glycosyltransferase involved in cell wall biosynthesis